MRHLVAFTLLVGFISTLSFGAEPKPFPKEIADVWTKQKHLLSWTGNSNNHGIISYYFDKSLLEENSYLPAFEVLPRLKPGDLKNLPAPAQPFGLKVYIDADNKHLIEELKTFKNLTRLSVSSSPIDEKELLRLAEISQLEELQLNGCKITNAGLKGFTKLKNLKKLGLRSTKITDEGISELKAFAKLEHLELGSNLEITDKSAPILAELKSLKFLDLHLTKITDEGLKTIAKMDQLTGLYLMNTKTTATGLKTLVPLKNLERFHMDGYAINSESISVVLGMKKLKHLGLDIPLPDKIAAGDAEFKKLEALPELQGLHVFGWQLTDESIPTIRSFKKLEFIELRNTNMKKASAEQLQKDLPKCRIFLPQ